MDGEPIQISSIYIDLNEAVRVAETNEQPDLSIRCQKYNQDDHVMLRHYIEQLQPGALNDPEKRMGPFRIRKKVSASAYELDLPSDMTISPVFNAEDLIPFYSLSDNSSSSSVPVSSSSPKTVRSFPASSNPTDQIPIPSLHCPSQPHNVNLQQTACAPINVLDERFVPTRHGGYHRYLVQWSGRAAHDGTWISTAEFCRLAPQLFDHYIQFSSADRRE